MNTSLNSKPSDVSFKVFRYLSTLIEKSYDEASPMTIDNLNLEFMDAGGNTLFTIVYKRQVLLNSSRGNGNSNSNSNKRVVGKQVSLNDLQHDIMMATFTEHQPDSDWELIVQKQLEIEAIKKFAEKHSALFTGVTSFTVTNLSISNIFRSNIRNASKEAVVRKNVAYINSLIKSTNGSRMSQNA